MSKKAIRTRNNNTLTEAAYFGKIRSVLRRGFMYWRPMMEALNNASRAYIGDNPRQKKEYQCAGCKDWFKRSDVHIDHIKEVGSLTCYEDVVPFIKNLTQEGVENYQVLCKVKCHQSKTNKKRKQNKDDKE